MKTIAQRAVPALIFALILLGRVETLSAKSSTNVLNLANPIRETTQTISIAYSPYGVVQSTGITTVNNGTKTADDRAYCVVFTLTNPGSQGGMSFGLYNANSGNQYSLSGSPGSSSEVISGNFAAGTPANTNVVYTIAFRLNPASMPAPGSYFATIREDLYGGSSFPPSGPVLDTNLLTVTISVGSFYDVSVVPSGATFSLSATSQNLNFGVLAPGETLGADILVRSNVSYSISLTSSGFGSLTNPLDSTSLVAYSLKSNGKLVSFNPGPATIASGASATYSNTDRYGITATILPFSGNPSAGNYSDTIFVTLSSP